MEPHHINLEDHMKVKLRNSTYGIKGEKGDVVEVDEDRGAELIAGQEADLVEEPASEPAPSTPEAPATDSSKPEAASSPTETRGSRAKTEPASEPTAAKTE